MGEDYITFTQINDFLFSPASLYMHGSFADMRANFYKEKAQIAGSIEHEAIEEGRYSSRKNIIQAKTVYSHKYKILGKIDVYDMDKKELIERKNRVSKIYKGHIFQVWAQYFALKEHGFEVEKIFIYSKEDNKKYEIPLPDEKGEKEFAKVLKQIRKFRAEELLKTHTDQKGALSIYGKLAW